MHSNVNIIIRNFFLTSVWNDLDAHILKKTSHTILDEVTEFVDAKLWTKILQITRERTNEH